MEESNPSYYLFDRLIPTEIGLLILEQMIFDQFREITFIFPHISNDIFFWKKRVDKDYQLKNIPESCCFYHELWDFLQWNSKITICNLRDAVRLKKHNIFKILLNCDRVVLYDVDLDDLLKYAINKHYLEIVELLLLDRKANPGFERNYPIINSSANGDLEIVKLLLSDKRVDCTDQDNIAIRYASENGHLEIVKLLLAGKK